MYRPRVGLITFGDERPHEWEKVFRRLTEPLHAQAVAFFRKQPLELVASDDVARNREEIDQQIDSLRQAKVDVLVAHVPCWTEPNLVVYGIQRLGLPTVLLSNKSPATHGTVGLLGAAGALDQIGYPHLRVREDFDSPHLPEKIMPFLRAAFAVHRLQGSVFGLFGGRSLGIDTGSFDPMQWRALFGIDTEHVDQLEIIRRAEQIPPEEAGVMADWLASSCKRAELNQEGLTPEKLNFQVRCYLATQQLIREMRLDFIAVKCMPDLSNYYVPQCISAAFVPSPYDAGGAKEPIAMACEADADGALTMQVLKLVSGGNPPLFGDLSYLNEETQTIYLPNCGGMCSWYAARSENPAENLGQIELRASIRPGGGAITYFHAAPGPITLARLFRRKGRYYMAMFAGEAVTPSSEELSAFVEARGRHQLPTMFVRTPVNFDRLIAEFGANHISGVAGNYVAELQRFCELLDITPILLA
ncbi:MAG: L-fucose/L-arabinose isomerase family protein [Anaerolineae bacterium]